MNTLNDQIPEFVSVSQLQRNYSLLLKRLRSSQKPLFVLKNDDLEAVILSPDTFKSLIEKNRIYEEEKALTVIGIYQKEKKEKKLLKMKKVEEFFE